MALSPNAAAKIAALLAKLGSFNANLDLEENARRKQSMSALAMLDEGLPTARTTVNRSLSDRGILQSGIGLDQQDKVTRNYLNSVNLANTERDTALSDIARRRLNEQAEFDYDVANINREDTFGQPLVPPPMPTTPVSTSKKPPKKKNKTQVSVAAQKKISAPPRQVTPMGKANVRQ